MKKSVRSRVVLIAIITLAIWGICLATAVGAATKIDLRKKSGELGANFPIPIGKLTKTKAVKLDSRNELKVIRTYNDKKGFEHVRYRQHYLGIPVWGEHVISNTKDGDRRLVGKFVDSIQEDIAGIHPAFDKTEALERMKAACQDPGISSNEPRIFENEQSELVIFVDKTGTARPAYSVSFFTDTQEGGKPARPHFIVDAAGGDILKQWDGLNRLRVGTGPGGNPNTGRYEYGVDFDFLDIEEQDGLCHMRSADRGVKTISSFHTTTFSADAPAYSHQCYRNLYKEINGGYGPMNDAHHFACETIDMLRSFGMDYPNTDGDIVIRVHYGLNYSGAFWNGSSASFGDGDGLTRYPYTVLDIVGHEIGHAFSEENSGLVSDSFEPSAAINESFSDMCGEAAEFYARGENDYIVGMDTVADNGDPSPDMRHMNDPPGDKWGMDHLDEYWHDVEFPQNVADGIFNKAFYQLSVTDGWDVGKAFHVFVWANRHSWTPNSDFTDAACGVMDAAHQLGYSVDDVILAFALVGIDCPDWQMSGGPNNPPFVEVTTPSTNRPTSIDLVIRWNDHDIDDDALVSLWYDTDNSGADGTLIANNFHEDDDGVGANAHKWDITGVENGNYHIYAVIDDGVNPPVVDYGEGTVTINHSWTPLGSPHVLSECPGLRPPRSSCPECPEPQTCRADGFALSPSDVPYAVSSIHLGNDLFEYGLMKYDGMNWNAVDGTRFERMGFPHENRLLFNKAGDLFLVQRFYDESVPGDYHTVLKHNGLSWENLGRVDGAVSQDAAIAADSSGIPYLVCKTDGHRMFVKKFNGVDWEIVGNEIPDKPDTDLSILFDSADTLYVAYTTDASYPEGDNGYYTTRRPYVRKLIGNEWVHVGPPGFQLGTRAYCSKPHLAFDSSDTPLVAFQYRDEYTFDYHNRPKKWYLGKFEEGDWQPIDSNGLSENMTCHSLAPDSSDMPHVACHEPDTGATVMKFDGVSWQPVGLVGFFFVPNAITFDSSNIPHLSFSGSFYGDGSSQYFVLKYAGGNLCIAGDVDRNGRVDLADQISAIQLLVGIPPVGPVCLNADINNNEKIGLAEVIFILRSVAGL